MERKTLGHKIKIARAEKNITQMALAGLLKTGHTVIVNWETGKYAPNQESLKKLAKALEKPLAYFLEDPGPVVYPEHKEPDGFRFVSDLVSVPVFARVRAGTPGYSDDDVLAHIPYPGPLGGKIGVVVRGDCMLPTFNNGDYLICKPQHEPIGGKVMVVETEEGFCIRRLRRVKNDGWELVCDNPDHPRRVYKPKKLIVRWQVVGCMHNYE